MHRLLQQLRRAPVRAHVGGSLRQRPRVVGEAGCRSSTSGLTSAPFSERWAAAWAAHVALRCGGQPPEAPTLRSHRLLVALQLSAWDGGRDLDGVRESFSAYASRELAALQLPGLGRSFASWAALEPEQRMELLDDARTALEASLSASAAPAVSSSAPAPSLGSLVLDPAWRAVVDSSASSSLAAFVASQRASGAVFPPPGATFAALNATPLASVRVVLLGQDPYHGPGQACGLAFSVPRGVAPPPSLRNVLRELRDDAGVAPPPGCGDLAPWAARGVLLLNAVLTVRSGEANSHAGRGWEAVTDAVVRAVASRPGPPAVFLLWGRAAQAKARLALQGTGGSHTVLEAPHPSGLSAYRGFIGCRHFTRANAALAATGQQLIDWTL